MTTSMVRYRVRDDLVATNATLVRAVYAQLAEVQPGGLRYATFQVEDDPAAFVHVAAVEGEGPGPLPGLPAFREFTRDVRERCVEGPATTSLKLVSAYRLY
jgi:hypothetical protein